MTNRKPMPDSEVKARFARIKKYNEHFAGTEHVVTEAQIFGFMTKEWLVNPADYGIKEPQRKEWKKGQKPEKAFDGIVASEAKREEAYNAV